MVSAWGRSCGARRAGLAVALIGLWLAISRVALGASFPVPSGWGEGDAAADEAVQRAEAWAQAWNAEVRQVMSSRAPDNFAETLVVLEVRAPIPTGALVDAEAGHDWLEPRVAQAMGASASLDPQTVERLPRPEKGVAVLLGRVELDDRVALIAVAPMGSRHLAVVMMCATSEELLYTSLFDGVVDGIDGLQAPVTPFPRGKVRWAALAIWLALGGLLGIAWTRRSLPRPGARTAGRQVAAMLFSGAALVLLAAGSSLGEAAVELALADSSPFGMALEIAMGGVIAAILVVLGTELWDRQLKPVASAPQQGSFAVAATPHRRGGSSTSLPRIDDAGPPEPAPVASSPAVTGNTQIGPAPTSSQPPGLPPAVTGNTQIGPPPAPPPASPPMAGEELETVIRHAPTGPPPLQRPPMPPGPSRTSASEDTAPRTRRSIVDAGDHPLPPTPTSAPRPGHSTGETEVASGADDGPASLVGVDSSANTNPEGILLARRGSIDEPDR